MQQCCRCVSGTCSKCKCAGSSCTNCRSSNCTGVFCRCMFNQVKAKRNTSKEEEEEETVLHSMSVDKRYTKSVRDIIREVAKDGTDVDEITNRIVNLFVDNTTVGGIYFLHITHLGGNPVRFFYEEQEDKDFALIKFGRTDKFSARWSQFSGVTFHILWAINADNGMEAALKKLIPANFMKIFYTAKVPTLKTYFKIPKSSNPAPSEWRIMGVELMTKLSECKINNLNYKEKILDLTQERWHFEEGDLEFSVGNHTQKNRNNFSVYH